MVYYNVYSTTCDVAATFSTKQKLIRKVKHFKRGSVTIWSLT